MRKLPTFPIALVAIVGVGTAVRVDEKPTKRGATIEPCLNRSIFRHIEPDCLLGSTPLESRPSR